MKHAADSSLRRVLNRWDLTALGVNQVIGSGIYLLPASVAVLVGAGASPLAWLAAALVNLLIILCFAEVGTRFRQAGGPYLYAREAFGAFAGFEVAWMIWLTRVASQGALANAFADYLAFFWPAANVGVGRIVTLTAVIGGLAALNRRGVRQGSWAVNFFTVSKLIPLLVFVAVGVFFIDWNAFSGWTQPRSVGFLEAVLLLMYAYGGYELITLPAGEAQSPRRDIPWALMLTIVLVTAVFLSVQMVAVGTLPGIETSDRPLADAAIRFLDPLLGPLGGVFMALGGLISIAGANAGTMLAGPRVTFAMGRRGQVPAFFAHVHPRFQTPDYSILAYATVALVLALSGGFVELAIVSAVARLVFYAATCAAVPVLRRRGPQAGFQLPGGVLIPTVALVATASLLLGATRQSLLAGGAALAAGALFHFLYRRSD